MTEVMRKIISTTSLFPVFRMSTKRKSFLLPMIGLLIIAFLLIPDSNEPITNHFPLINDDEKEITLIFAGDIMQHLPQVEAAWNRSEDVYNYDTCFSFIKPWLFDADIAIANLETTLDGKPYSGYPAFSSPDALINSLLWAGVDLLGTANNHCCDRGKSGLLRTIYVLDSLRMPHMGTYKNEKEYKKRNPLIVNKNGFKLAFLNYTYGTNGIPVPENTIVSLIENNRIILDLKAAKDSLVDKIIVFIHWGEEYQRVPNAYQKEVAALLFDNGADIIIGSHPHVIQPMEWHQADSSSKEKIVVWSLGNFVSNQRKQYTDGGTMFEVKLQKKLGITTIKDAGYKLSWVYNPIIDGQRKYYILPAAQHENDTLLLNDVTLTSLQQFLLDSRNLLDSKNIGIREFK